MKFFKRLLATTLAIATIVTSTCIGANAVDILHQSGRKSMSDTLGVMRVDWEYSYYDVTNRVSLLGLLYNLSGSNRYGEISMIVRTSYSGDDIVNLQNSDIAPTSNIPPLQVATSTAYVPDSIYVIHAFGTLYNGSTKNTGILSSVHDQDVVVR